MTQTTSQSTVGVRSARRSRLELPCCVRQWELVGLAAEGSWARIYHARPAGTPGDRPAAYAVKMLRPRWENDDRAVQLLVREAQVGRSVSHPHLISILEAHVRRPPRLVVMPWLEGTTLDRVARGLLDLPLALWIARQVAEALDALQEAGWMHGDIKPSNVFLSPDRHVTLLDLGFARRTGETGSAADRVVTGTCHYIAPECITSTLRTDIRSDVYSLGAILFQLLSGRLPFEGKDMAELATQHKQSIPPDLHHLVPHLPLGVVRLVRQMMAKEPLRRPQTPRELIDRLAALEIETFSERAAG